MRALRRKTAPRRSSLLLRLTPLVLSSSLAMAAAGEPEPPPTVDEIAERHIAARGGAERIAALSTLVYRDGVYEEGDFVSPGDAFMAFARPYYRVVGDPEAPGGYMEGYDGAAWEWYAEPGFVVRTVGAAAGATRRGADFEGMLVDYRAKGSRVELGEPTRIAGRPAYRLKVTLRDGFVRELFVDQVSYLVVAERRSAPIHAFGEPVTSETRVGDYRPVAGVLFAHSYVETDLATGEELNRMRWGAVEANRDLPRAWFSPPRFERTPLGRFLELLYAERADADAVLWSYHDFRRAHPRIDTRDGMERIGYQMLKMGDVEAAIALLEANAREHPDASTSAFGLGRAYETARRRVEARREYRRAVELDPDYGRAAAALAAVEAELASASGPLAFLEPFVGSWFLDPDSELVRSDPAQADFVAFRFEWGDPRRKLLRFYEGIPGGDFERRILENLVTYDPRSGEVTALGYQLANDYLYRSTFRPWESGYERDYRVTYPSEQEFSHPEDRERGWIRYRDRCRPRSPDRLHCVTERMRAGEWLPWGPPEGYTAVRR